MYPLAAVTLSTPPVSATAHQASTFASAESSTSNVDVAPAPLPRTREQLARGTSAQRFSFRTAPVSSVSTAASTTSSLLVAVSSALVQSASVFPTAPSVIAVANRQTRPLTASRAATRAPDFATSSQVASESIGQLSGSAATLPIFTSLPTESVSHGPSAARSLKPIEVTSPSAEQMDVTSEVVEGEEEEDRHDPLDLPMRDFLIQFTQQIGKDALVLLHRPLLTALMDLDFTFDEFLPPAECPEQRVLSTMAYLQIASEEAAEILPMSLKEFNGLVNAVVREQYGALAAPYRPRELSLDRIRGMVGRVVRDPTGVLSGESASESRSSAPSPSGPSTASSLLPLPSGTGVTMEFVKGLVAAAAAKFAVPVAPVPRSAHQPEAEWRYDPLVPQPAPSSTVPSAAPSQSEVCVSEEVTATPSEMTVEDGSQPAAGLLDEPVHFAPAEFTKLLTTGLDKVATSVLGVPSLTAPKSPRTAIAMSKSSRHHESGSHREKSKSRHAEPSPKRAKRHAVADDSVTSVPRTTPKAPESRRLERERRRATVEAKKSLRKKTQPLELLSSEEEESPLSGGVSVNARAPSATTPSADTSSNATHLSNVKEEESGAEEQVFAVGICPRFSAHGSDSPTSLPRYTAVLQESNAICSMCQSYRRRSGVRLRSVSASRRKNRNISRLRQTRPPASRITTMYPSAPSLSSTFFCASSLTEASLSAMATPAVHPSTCPTMANMAATKVQYVQPNLTRW